MKNITLQIVFNNCSDWTTIPQKVADIKRFYAGILNLTIDVVHTSFNNIPFQKSFGSDGSSGKEVNIFTEIVDVNWFDANITTKALAHDMVLFYIPEKDKVGHVTSAGIRGDNEHGPVELSLFGVKEFDRAYNVGVDQGNALVLFACHEIAHGLYLMYGGVDNVHQYFYSQNPADIFNHLNFNTKISNTEVRVRAITRAINYIKKLIASFSPTPIPAPVPIIPVTPVVPVTPPSSFPHNIIVWANSIKREEGWSVGSVSYKNNNPGNIKYASFTKARGATQGSPATDGGYFSKFPTQEAGFNALCEFLVLGCKDQLLAFHDARTLKDFTQVYAHPPQNHPYAENVAKDLGVTVDVKISTLI